MLKIVLGNDKEGRAEWAPLIQFPWLLNFTVYLFTESTLNVIGSVKVHCTSLH